MGRKKLRIARAALLAGILILVGACASTETKVSCDGRLQPINGPSAAKADAIAKNSERAPQGVAP